MTRPGTPSNWGTRPDRRQAPAHLRVEFDAVVATWRDAFQVDDATARATVRQGVGLALRCGRPFDFAAWVEEHRLGAAPLFQPWR